VDGVTAFILGRVILAIFMAIVGLAALSGGLYLYLKGVGQQTDDAAASRGKFGVKLKTVGSVVMATSIGWGYLAYLTAPKTFEDSTSSSSVGIAAEPVRTGVSEILDAGRAKIPDPEPVKPSTPLKKTTKTTRTRKVAASRPQSPPAPPAKAAPVDEFADAVAAKAPAKPTARARRAPAAKARRKTAKKKRRTPPSASAE
jgi:hypothetical protein